MQLLAERLVAVREAVDDVTDTLTLWTAGGVNARRQARALVRYLNGVLLALGLPRRRPRAKLPPVDVEAIRRVVEERLVATGPYGVVPKRARARRRPKRTEGTERAALGPDVG